MLFTQVWSGPYPLPPPNLSPPLPSFPLQSPLSLSSPRSRMTCTGNTPGSLGEEEIDAATFAEWVRITR